VPVETVRVAFLDDQVAPEFVNGVAVRVVDSAGALVTTATSGLASSGLAEFDLPGSSDGLVYQLRFYKAGTRISPRNIRVFSPPSAAPLGTNEFLVTAQIFRLPPAEDPHMCRIGGVLLGPRGKPLRNTLITFQPQFAAFVMEQELMVSGKFSERTDDQGRITVDLQRYGIYDVFIESGDGVRRTVSVPNRSFLHVSHLLFPVVVSVTYTEEPPFTVAVGQDLELHPLVRSSDFQRLGVALDDALYSIADPSIATVRVASDHIVVRGLTPGSTKVRVARADTSIVYVPDVGIAGGEVDLIVTP
jgi:hypothetical protein